MSNHHRFPGVLVALVVGPLLTVLACSGRGRDTGPADIQPADTSVAIGDARTLEALFEGRFPGVTVARADGGGLLIRIRGGSNSFYGSSEPLYVVDDNPIPSVAGGIVYLNPYDIDKIEVLKNPADIGIYGIRGANGVIKITTKRAGRR